MGWVALVVFPAVFGLVVWGAGRAQRRTGDLDSMRRASGAAEGRKFPPDPGG
jgi:hypothetical protein